MRLFSENRLWFAACAIVACVYVLTAPRIWQCEGVDEVEYLGLAHSLVLGQGFTLYGQPHVYYPPLFPAFLSVLMRFGVTAWHRMYVANACLGIASFIMIGIWMRRAFGSVGRWASWLTLLSYYGWSFSVRYLMSEPLFALFSFATFIVAWRVLQRNSGRMWEYALLGAGCLLCAMTRSAAVVATLALIAAGGIRWVTTRRPAGLAVAALALLLGGGFFVAWGIVRPERVNPNATETHWRWAKKIMGLSKETQGLVARNEGEGATAFDATYAGRLITYGVKYGQYVTSIVRLPRGAEPLAVMLFIVFLAGLIAHWRGCLWSPLAAYAILLSLLTSATKFVSNYTRILFSVGPFLFLFLVEGLQLLRDALRSQRGAGARIFCGVFGTLGLIWVVIGGAGAEAAGAERTYMQVVAAACVLCYVGLLALAIMPRLHRLADGLMPMLLVVYALHSAVLVAGRYRMVVANDVLRARNLEGVVRCGRWLEQNSAASSRCVASVPRLVALLAARRFDEPVYAPAGGLAVNYVNYVLLMGPLRAVPQFRADRESALVEGVRPLEQSGRLDRVFEDGDAAVFRVKVN